MSGAALFIAGTDTGVGKTTVAVALCRAFREHGLRVGVFKPVETGCEDLDAPSDAAALAHAAGSDLPMAHICPYRFVEPLAPAVAAERAGATIDIALLQARLETLRAAHDLVLVEGAGGLLVPLSGSVLTVDWVADMGLPVLLVGRLGLGTLNHTLLSARSLRDRDMNLLATVLCQTEPDDSVAAATNAGVLRRFPEVRLAGVVSHAQAPTGPVLPPGLADQLARALGRADIFDVESPPSSVDTGPHASSKP